jgi:hypothetical protein
LPWSGAFGHFFKKLLIQEREFALVWCLWSLVQGASHLGKGVCFGLVPLVTCSRNFSFRKGSLLWSGAFGHLFKELLIQEREFALVWCLWSLVQETYSSFRKVSLLWYGAFGHLFKKLTAHLEKRVPLV